MFEKFRVYLRALELDDYKKSIEWRNDEEIWDMVVGPKYFVSEAYEKKWVEDRIYARDNTLVLAIVLKEDKRHIGYVYLTSINQVYRSADYGILLGNRDVWGLGLATEATILMLNHGFRVLGLERIGSKQLISNTASIKVHEKCGFIHEGVLRNAAYKNGSFVDLNAMSILRNEFDVVVEGLQKSKV